MVFVVPSHAFQTITRDSLEAHAPTEGQERKPAAHSKQ
ncbi:hypothetical protein BURKHO8Y_370025 [Burkholderia sp. 8Y]|nr:hypothetical protein BURKHO8Y_370025 [Burkholderia sp. 8Y]